MAKKTKKWAVLTATVLLGLGVMITPQMTWASTALSGNTANEENATATGDHSTAIGDGAKASGNDSIAIGNKDHNSFSGYTLMSDGVEASGDGSTAIGSDSKALGDFSTALGKTAQSYAWGGISIGASASVGNFTSIEDDTGYETGYELNAEGKGGIAIGSGVRYVASIISGDDGITYNYYYKFGTGASVIADYGVALGTRTSVSGEKGVAIGYGSLATGYFATAIGTTPSSDNYSDSGAVASGNSSIAFGAKAQASETGSIAIGGLMVMTDSEGVCNSWVSNSAANASADYALAIGTWTSVSGTKSVALGYGSKATVENAVALGQGSQATVANTISVGSASNQRRIMNVATGTADTDAVNYAQLKSYVAEHGGSGESGTSYTGSDTITIGTDNKISVTNMAMSTTGANLGATAGGEYSFAIGGSAVASGNQSVALGYKAVAGSTDSEETLEGATVAIGATANATGNGSVALGYGAATTGNDAVALGSTAQAAAKDSGAIGSHARSYNTGAMAIGAESIAYGEGSATLGYNAFAGGARSLALGNEAKAGYYINGNYYGGGDSAVAIGDNSWAIGNYNVAIGYGAAAGISSDYQTLVVGGTAIGLGAGAFGEGATAIGDGSRVNNQGATAIGLDTYSNADFSTSVGFTAQAFGESGTAIGYQAVVGSDKGITTEYGNKVSTVSFGHQKDDTYYESNTSGGFDVKKYTDTVLARLTNVADGKGNTDAATYGQIIKAQALTTDANTGLVTKVTPYKFENGVATIYTNNGGIAFQLEMPSGTISTEDGTSKGDGYITGKEVANELALKNADGASYTGTYAQTGKTTGQNLAALDSQVVQNTSDISTLQTKVSGFESKIDGVKLADSDLEFDFSGGKTSVTQNVNYSDGTSKAFSITISGISGGADSAVIGDTTKLSDKGLGDNVTDSILSVNDKLVKEGTYTATNGKVEVKNNAGNVAFTIDGLAVSSADVGDTSKLSAAGLGDNVTDSILSVNDKVGSLSDDINKVGAGAAALAALRPEGFDPDDKWSFAVGYGHYKNANAGALGAFFKPNADTTVSIGGTIGNGDPMMNAGVSFKIGNRGKKAGTYRNAVELVRRVDGLEATMTKEVKRNDIQDSRLNAQEKKIAELEANIAKMQQKIAALLSESGAAN